MKSNRLAVHLDISFLSKDRADDRLCPGSYAFMIPACGCLDPWWGFGRESEPASFVLHAFQHLFGALADCERTPLLAIRTRYAAVRHTLDQYLDSKFVTGKNKGWKYAEEWHYAAFAYKKFDALILPADKCSSRWPKIIARMKAKEARKSEQSAGIHRFDQRPVEFSYRKPIIPENAEWD